MMALLLVGVVAVRVLSGLQIGQTVRPVTVNSGMDRTVGVNGVACAVGAAEDVVRQERSCRASGLRSSRTGSAWPVPSGVARGGRIIEAHAGGSLRRAMNTI